MYYCTNCDTEIDDNDIKYDPDVELDCCPHCNSSDVDFFPCEVSPGKLMTPYRAQHADLFRAVAEILVRDYIAPSETVAEWCEKLGGSMANAVTYLQPSELAALIADVEGYERRQA